MHHVRVALELTTCHGLPRIVTNKPIYVRLAWLLLFCVAMSLFLKGFMEFVGKLQSNPASTSLDINDVNFLFPDMYTCFENPISGSYSANINSAAAAAINDQLNKTRSSIEEYVKGIPENNRDITARFLSFVQPQSLQYQLLADTLGQRLEQSIISGGLVYRDTSGMPHYEPMIPAAFYHPVHLRCAKWVLDSNQTENLRKGGTSSGLLLKVLLDINSSFIQSKGEQLRETVYTLDSPMPVSEWPLTLHDILSADRASGVRVYLSPPGQYPSIFETSFSLSPGKSHTVEIGMTQQVYKAGQFNCLSDTPSVQFVNPYDQTPYNHSYSYSYCFYHEYQKLYQINMNMSGDRTPMTWDLRGKESMFNLTSSPNLINWLRNMSALPGSKSEDVQLHATKSCESKRSCSTLDYSISVSSSDWPTESSFAPFINTSIKYAWLQAKAMNLSVPALDFLLTGNATSVASYVRANLLKVLFKPKSLTSDRVTFSRDYGASNFISDVGGILGIYLGMSLLTLCEICELIFDLASHANSRRKAKQPTVSAVTPMGSGKMSD